MPVEVVVGQAVHGDLRALPTDALRREALGYLLKLRERPRLGLRLSEMNATGDLSDCRKIYFGGADYRIVYQVEPSSGEPQRVRVIAVGRRARLEAYRTAVTRLGR